MTDSESHQRIRRAFLGMDMTWIAGVGAILLIVGGLAAYQFDSITVASMEPRASVFRFTHDKPFAALPDQAAAVTAKALLRGYEVTCEVAAWSAPLGSIAIAWCPTIATRETASWLAETDEEGENVLLAMSAETLADGLAESESSASRLYSTFLFVSGRAHVQVFDIDNRKCADFVHFAEAADEGGYLAAGGQVCLNNGLILQGLSARDILAGVTIEGWAHSFRALE